MTAEEIAGRWRRTCKALSAVTDAAREVEALTRGWAGSGPTARALADLRTALVNLDVARKGG